MVFEQEKNISKWLGKIAITVLLVFLLWRFYYVSEWWAFGIVLVYLFIPAIFVFYLKKPFILAWPKFAKIWRWLKIIYLILVVLGAIMFFWGNWREIQRQKTQDAISKIESFKITIDDVMGENLPPEPNKAINDSTVEGIDANKNGIRDDVELEIFRRYPDSARMRAAMLQYAQALQLRAV